MTFRMMIDRELCERSLILVSTGECTSGPTISGQGDQDIYNTIIWFILCLSFMHATVDVCTIVADLWKTILIIGLSPAHFLLMVLRK